MLEIWHMHELDWMCHFVMGFPTWVKCKLEKNWPTSLFEAIIKVEGFSDVEQVKSLSSKRRINSPIKRHAMKGNADVGETFQKGKDLNNFNAQVLNPKVILSKRGLP
jgi:hypothetical protein